ncbi:hypothetical protein [Desulforhabdus sp. TSK]|uniref:hypothetical protein n=1 Tax=Desulforhabdus sp. TSK TaxID=2925014 RepID=UPI001FC88455|nr:hypothetical protein [Desulforhabdus sp. TSK]
MKNALHSSNFQFTDPGQTGHLPSPKPSALQTGCTPPGHDETTHQVKYFSRGLTYMASLPALKIQIPIEYSIARKEPSTIKQLSTIKHLNYSALMFPIFPNPRKFSIHGQK